MREIKFRGQMVINNNWVYGSLLLDNRQNAYGPQIMWYEDTETQFVSADIDPTTLGQFTGLKDNNGCDIYEGDILDCRRDQSYWRGVVRFNAPTYFIDFDFTSETLRREFFKGGIEVIGNIYEHPELIKAVE